MLVGAGTSLHTSSQFQSVSSALLFDHPVGLYLARVERASLTTKYRFDEILLDH